MRNISHGLKLYVQLRTTQVTIKSMVTFSIADLIQGLFEVNLMPATRQLNSALSHSETVLHLSSYSSWREGVNDESLPF